MAEASPSDLPAKTTQKQIVNSIGMRLVLIPAGGFVMGTPKEEKDRRPHEGPQHALQITKPFYMGVYEVTQEEFEKILGKEKIGAAHVTIMVEGDVAAVNAAVEAGRTAAEKVGTLVAAHVIARPHEALARLLPR